MMNGHQFWHWFIENKSDYLGLDELSQEALDRRLDRFLEKLHDYNEGLFFAMSNAAEGNELVITADGNTRYFKDVEQLVGSAPYIEDWRIVAFKKAVGMGFTTNYEGILLDPEEIWFVVLGSIKDPASFGLRLYVDGFTEADNKRYLSGAFEMLDNLLGEKACALHIDYVEVEQLPADPEAQQLSRLSELPALITTLERESYD